MSNQLMVLFTANFDRMRERTSSSQNSSLPYSLSDHHHQKAKVAHPPVLLQFWEHHELYGILHQCTNHRNNVLLAYQECWKRYQNISKVKARINASELHEIKVLCV